jgi:hypothetical protein
MRCVRLLLIVLMVGCHFFVDGLQERQELERSGSYDRILLPMSIATTTGYDILHITISRWQGQEISATRWCYRN